MANPPKPGVFVPLTFGPNPIKFMPPAGSMRVDFCANCGFKLPSLSMVPSLSSLENFCSIHCRIEREGGVQKPPEPSRFMMPKRFNTKWGKHE